MQVIATTFCRFLQNGNPWNGQHRVGGSQVGYQAKKSIADTTQTY